MSSEIIAALVGLVCTTVSGLVTFFLTKRKYNTEVDAQQLQNTRDAFENYKAIMEEALASQKKRMEETIASQNEKITSQNEKIDYLQKENDNLRNQLTQLQMQMIKYLGSSEEKPIQSASKKAKKD